MTGRAGLRRGMRARRRALSARERAARAEALGRVLGTHPLFVHSRRIAGYLAADGELDPRPLLERAWSLGKRVFLPVLAPVVENRLWFAPYEPDERLVANRFGIGEPALAHRTRVRPSCLDLVLAPLVAFDPAGNRLGMGGGYYDRTFAYLRTRRHWRTPRLVGIAYGFQGVEQLPSRWWDIPLHAVATDEGVITCAPGARATT